MRAVSQASQFSNALSVRNDKSTNSVASITRSKESVMELEKERKAEEKRLKKEKAAKEAADAAAAAEAAAAAAGTAARARGRDLEGRKRALLGCRQSPLPAPPCSIRDDATAPISSG